MNIFALHGNPQICAKWHCDVHVVSQLKEAAQIMSAACQLRGVWDESLYKVTHLKHPCCIWASQSLLTLEWLLYLAFELNVEYGKRREIKGRPNVDHRSYQITCRAWEIATARKNRGAFPDAGMPPWAQAMPKAYQRPPGTAPVGFDIANHPVITAYRDYYRMEKRELRNSKGVMVPATWTPEGPPEWWDQSPSSAGPADTIFEEFF